MENLNNCILSTAYWPNIQYFTKVVSYTKVYIEQFETFPKQSYRNRCALYGPNSIQTLQIPILKGAHNQITKDVRIAYQMPWQKNHFQTIKSLYKSSPFFDYYTDDIEFFYNKKYNFLLDYNNAIFEVCCRWLKIGNNTELTSDYVKIPLCPDFRNTIHPKQSHQAEDKNFNPSKYTQVFSDRFGFIPNLSIIDLVMNCGPDSVSILKSSGLILKNKY